ncbi:hypothetical protein [Sorangium cellulosum]|uniref:Uncharacterized protein n=1 Tax=Sorangium cellulosum TaxID=56 RepID=A0A150QGL7_SORCE|nr:hypothetical protein [Sorangium cellulosum]KYF67002.1 hypothetical protein BE15_38570 [Sorangium cellulosum]
MIKPDDITVYDDAAKAELANEEQKIDANLRAGKGYYEFPTPMKSEARVAFWCEIARRYRANGWIVETRDGRNLKDPDSMVIKHPAYTTE